MTACQLTTTGDARPNGAAGDLPGGAPAAPRRRAPGALLAEVVTRAAAHAPDGTARAVLDRLALEPDHAVLELGCGAGRALAQVAARLPRGFLAGLDPSELALRHAGLRCRRLVESGRVRLVSGRSDDLGAFADARFDRVVAVHVVYLWDDPRRDLSEILRVLRPGGRLLLGYRPVKACAPGDPTCFATPRLERLLDACGFRAVRTERDTAAGRPIAWTSAQRGGADADPR